MIQSSHALLQRVWKKSDVASCDVVFLLVKFYLGINLCRLTKKICHLGFYKNLLEVILESIILCFEAFHVNLIKLSKRSDFCWLTDTIHGFKISQHIIMVQLNYSKRCCEVQVMPLHKSDLIYYLTDLLHERVFTLKRAGKRTTQIEDGI